MNLYLISQTEECGYDTYDSAVVAAMSENSARHKNPGGKWNAHYTGWCKTPDKVTVKLIGKAASGIRSGFICKSFNAG